MVSDRIVTTPTIDPRVRAFYVSVINPAGTDYRLMLGPFNHPERAAAHVKDVRDHLHEQRYRDAHWMRYGTAGCLPPGPYRLGILNSTLHIEPDEIDDSAPQPVLTPPPPPTPTYFRPFEAIGAQCRRCARERRLQPAGCRCGPITIKRDIRELLEETHTMARATRYDASLARYVPRYDNAAIISRLTVAGNLRRLLYATVEAPSIAPEQEELQNL